MGKTIVTHGPGSFHADDVGAITILKEIYPDAKIIRTRDMDIINSADIVVDVGLIYDPSKGRFDHHQKGGAAVHEQTGIQKSSIGLVWEHYGLEIVSKFCGETDKRQLDQIWNRVNWNLIQVIDAGDTGSKISEQIYDGVIPYNVSQIISNFNPGWDSVEDYDTQFELATEFFKSILINEILAAKGTIKARNVVLGYINEAQDKDSKVIVFDKHLPWIGTVCKNTYDELYVVYPSENDDWRLHCIPDFAGSFDKRKSLPAEWAGAREEELNKLVGINDAVFCHTARFIAGAKSFESIMKMAQLAIEE
jgi:uncharacterized UPF0160 family protein